MSLYVAIRFKGIVKKELREVFAPVALTGKWQNCQDEVIRDFGEAYKTTYLSGGGSGLIDKWKADKWENCYNTETGEWIFETDINQRRMPYWEFEDEIIPYLMESVEHLELYYEAWESDREVTTVDKYENGEFELVGWIDEAGKWMTDEEIEKEQERLKRIWSSNYQRFTTDTEE